jgi:hypothetical protein
VSCFSRSRSLWSGRGDDGVVGEEVFEDVEVEILVPILTCGLGGK